MDVNVFYKSFSCALCVAILFLCVYLCILSVISIYDLILSVVLAICVFVSAVSEYNIIAKFCIVLIVSAVCHLQFVNINVDIKYNCGDLTQNEERLYMLYSLCYTYCMYQQWCVLFSLLKDLAWKWVKIGVTIFTIGCILPLLFFLPSIIKMPNVFLYYIPLIHYVTILTL